MNHRNCAALVLICLSLGFAGCTWMKQKPSGEVKVMPQQTGSGLQRHVMVPKTSETAETAAAAQKKKKSEKTRKTAKKSEPETLSAEPTPKPKPKPALEEAPSAPDRFR